jgi:ABC-type transporter Mla subunit MlaD
MAQISRSEFERAVTALVDHFGLDRTRDKLARFGAFRARRGLGSRDALADRLFRLTGGLRMSSPATYAFSALWAELISAHLGEDGSEKIDALAEGVNACLGDGDHLVAGKEAELDTALAKYRAALAEKTGDEIADLDMLLKAVPDVAERLRGGSAARDAASEVAS